MNTTLGHIVFGVRPANIPFYKELFDFLGWHTVYESQEMLGVADANRVSLWFGSYLKDVTNDYDGPGVNHVAIDTAAQADVDAAAEFLRGRGIAMLFETPRHRPEFSEEGSTYYQIMFETPDRLLVEVVYTGPKES